MCQKARKSSKTNELRTKGQMSQLEVVATGQNYENLSFKIYIYKIMIMDYNTLNKIKFMNPGACAVSSAASDSLGPYRL